MSETRGSLNQRVAAEEARLRTHLLCQVPQVLYAAGPPTAYQVHTLSSSVIFWGPPGADPESRT